MSRPLISAALVFNRVAEEIKRNGEIAEQLFGENAATEHMATQDELVSTAFYRDRTIFVFADENEQFHSIIAKTSELSPLFDLLSEHLPKADESED